MQLQTDQDIKNHFSNNLIKDLPNHFLMSKKSTLKLFVAVRGCLQITSRFWGKREGLKNLYEKFVTRGGGV